jgi:hypothetical protein
MLVLLVPILVMADEKKKNEESSETFTIKQLWDRMEKDAGQAREAMKKVEGNDNKQIEIRKGLEKKWSTKVRVSGSIAQISTWGLLQMGDHRQGISFLFDAKGADWESVKKMDRGNKVIIEGDLQGCLSQSSQKDYPYVSPLIFLKNCRLVDDLPDKKKKRLQELNKQLEDEQKPKKRFREEEEPKK